MVARHLATSEASGEKPKESQRVGSHRTAVHDHNAGWQTSLAGVPYPELTLWRPVGMTRDEQAILVASRSIGYQLSRQRGVGAALQT